MIVGCGASADHVNFTKSSDHGLLSSLTGALAPQQ